MILTTAELGYFETFFITDCASGALSFEWAHPRTGTTTDFRFVGQPVYERVSGSLWSVTFNVEQLP